MTYLVSHEEAELVEANLDYHLDRGVDFVVATANNVPPDTLELLERYAEQGVLHLVVETDEDYAQVEWVNRMVHLASTDFEADWIVNLDADEFLWSDRGSLKEVFATIPPEYGVLFLPVTNFVPRPDDGRPLLQRMTARRVVTILATGKVHRPKIAHRAKPHLAVGRGSMGLDNDDFPALRGWEPITILHFPLRSYGQFETKIATAAATLGRNPDFHSGEIKAREIRTRARLLEEGRLADAYEEQVIDDERLAAEIRAGHLVIDERLRDHVASLGRDGAGSRAARSSRPADGRVAEELALEMRRDMHRFEYDLGELALRRQRDLTAKLERRLAAAEGRLERCEERREQLRARVEAAERSPWRRLREALPGGRDEPAAR